MTSPLMMRLLALLFLPLGQAAPKEGALRRPDPEEQHQPLPNPFQPGQERLRLLQRYLKGLERMDEEPEHMSREQVLLYLVALHDYDQSGQLDGLELLSLLMAALAPGAANAPTPDPVILLVDQVLETQDLNGDGLMTPAELINFPEEAPRHAEPQAPHAEGQQPLFTESPPGQGVQEAQVPEDQARGQAEAEGGPPGPEGAVGGHPEAEGPPGLEGRAGGHAEVEEPPSPGGETWDHAEAEGPPGPEGGAGGPPSPGGEVGGYAEAEGPPSLGGRPGAQEEALDTRGEAEELPGGALAPKGTPEEVEVHDIQVENDEM
ncbi:cell growth regulator with EF hand domain protein 1 [Sorex fumeus]|uniref:cell growth regulator with EF hand domain protein 1 n=1 Tax=Sorex fumeus TaxID=62283 RepID=UPI0024ACFE81|nr:cell growth regulator with EF hand domain protein 1 [Sorex fumeus]